MRTDAELIEAVRDDHHESAYAELYARHRTAAHRLASSYRRADDPEDLVNEAFELVLAAIKRGAGPNHSFRAYLFVTLRRLAVERLDRALDDELVDEVPEPVDVAQQSTALDPADRQIVISAYLSLPDRPREVLWHSTVEGRQPQELAATFGVSANAVSALAYRAREKLRRAYLQAHVNAAPRPQCEPHRSRLGGYVRDGLGRRDQVATRDHIDVCTDCTDLVGELRDINLMLVHAVRPRPVDVSAEDSGAPVSTSAPASGGWLRRWVEGLSKQHVIARAAMTMAESSG